MLGNTYKFLKIDKNDINPTHPGGGAHSAPPSEFSPAEFQPLNLHGWNFLRIPKILFLKYIQIFETKNMIKTAMAAVRSALTAQNAKRLKL